MKKLFWLILFVPALTFSQVKDTSLQDYIRLADSAYEVDNYSLQAYKWYIAAVILGNDSVFLAENLPDVAYSHEKVAQMSYDFGLFEYALLYYESAFAHYRTLKNSNAIYRVIPRVALVYQAMRESDKGILPPEADELETAEVYYRIIGKPEKRDGKVYVKINGGIADGIYKSSIGYAYGVHKNQFERANLKLGDAFVYQLDTNSTVIEIAPVEQQDSAHLIYEGDMVQMLSLIPKVDYRSLIWELALDQIVFLNELKEPIYDYRMLLKYDSQVLQDEILEIMRRDIYSTWEWLRDLEERDGFENIFEDKATRGRYKGYSVYQAMEVTTKEDILAFLGFVKSYPGKYMGVPYKINETYATWLLNECFIGFDEFLAMILKAETDADYKKLVDEYYEEITEDEFFIRLNMYAEDYAELKDIENARALNARVIKLASFIEDQSYTGWAYFNKGRIYDYVGEDDTTVYYYELAIPYFERSGDLLGVAFCQNNLASIYESYGEYKKANQFYRKALSTKQELHKLGEVDRSNNFYSMSKSNSGIGNTEYLQANYDSSLKAYEIGIAYADSAESLEGKEYAVALLTDMARVYKSRGQYLKASESFKQQIERYKQLGKPDEIAGSMDDLADVLFSKGDYQESFNNYYQAHQIKISLKDYSGAGFSLSNCAQSIWNLGDLDSAISLHEKAIGYRQKANDQLGVAYAYSKIGALFKELGSAEKATYFYSQSITTYEEYGDLLDVAKLSVDVGELYESLKNYTKALEYYNNALALYKERGMKSKVANVNSYIGYVYYELKDYKKAEKLYSNALAIRIEMNERQSMMYSLIDVSSVLLYAYYNYDSAQVLLYDALELATEIGSVEYQAYCHEYIGHAYYFRAQTKLAKENYELAYQFFTENGNVLGQCNMLLNLGASELQRGEFESAFKLYNQSLSLARDKKLSLQIANTYNYLAEYYYYTGEFANAFSVIDSSYTLFSSVSNEYGIANTHIVDGNTHNLIGNGSESFKQYKQADSIYALLKDPLSRATAINNMGTIKFFQGDYNEALRLFGRCRFILDSVGVKSSLLSTVTGNVGEIYMEKGIWDESKKWLDEAIGFAQEMGSTRDVWSHKTIYAKLLYKQGRYQESIDVLENCFAAFEKSDEKMAIADVATSLGKSYQALGELNPARNYYQEAIDVYKQIGSKKLIWEPLYQLALIEKEEQNTLASVSLLKEAVDTLETLSSDIVGSNANKKLFATANDKKNIYQELIAQLVESGEIKTAWVYQEKLNVYGLTEQTRGEPTRGAGDANSEEFQLSELQLQADGIYAQLMKEKAKPADQRSSEKIAELEKRMSVATETYQNFYWDLIDNGVIQNEFANSINPEQLDQLRYDLDEDIVILEYLATDNQLIIFIASADTLGAKIIDISKENLESYINGYYGLLVNQAEFEVLDQASHQLYQVLIEPVLPMIEGKNKIAFIPTGNMFKLPFQSLGKPIPDGMHYIIQDYDIFYLNDLSSTMNRQILDAENATLMAFGNADSSLIHAEKEVSMILETFPDASVYIKKDAKEDVAKTSMNDYQIVHFATHGNLDPIDFSNSYLTMAPNMDAGEDGKLTMREINRIRTLRGCQLIVLSACNTAVNDEKLEGWINNPAKAFLRKGAKSAIASLWSVDDAATGRLMQHFYQNLKNGQTKVVALNNAQKELVTSAFFSHPYYWSAFELIGQWE